MTSYMRQEAQRSAPPVLTLVLGEKRSADAAREVSSSSLRARASSVSLETTVSILPELNKCLLQSVSALELYRRLLALVDLKSFSMTGKTGCSDLFSAFQELLASSEARCASPSLSLKTRAVLLGILQEVVQDEERAFLDALVCWLGEQLDGWLEAALRDPDLAGPFRMVAQQHRLVQSWWRKAQGTQIQGVAGHCVASVGSRSSRP